MTLLTWFSSVRDSSAFCGALMPESDASRMLARWRRQNCLERLAIP